MITHDSDAPALDNNGLLRAAPRPTWRPEQWRQEDRTPATDDLGAGHDPPRDESTGGIRSRATAAPSWRTRSAPTIRCRVASRRAICRRSLVNLVAACLEKDPARRPTAAVVVDRLDPMIVRGRGPAAGEESPFRGLLPFTEAHAEFFFGREAEISTFLERFREEPILPVVGPSGAGKSSFVQAGVIPRLREQGAWLILRLRPRGLPFRTWRTCLLDGEKTASMAVESSVTGHSWRVIRVLRPSSSPTRASSSQAWAARTTITPP